MTETEQGTHRREDSAAPPASGWPLAWRLLVPLSLVAALFCGALSYLLIHTVSSTMDRTVDLRLVDLAEALVQGGFAMDDEMLARVHEVTDAELAVLSPDGFVLASTLSPAGVSGLARFTDGSVGVRDVVLEGQRHRLVSRRLMGAEGVPRATLVVASSTGSSDLLKRRQAFTIVLASGAGLVLLLVVGLAVVNSAARPLARLAEAAREAGAGKLESQVPGGGGREIDTLATEFNSMLGELIQSREELVRAEKLAAAGSMAATVAHEIRNPLSSIRMNVQLLEQRAGEQLETRRELKEVVEEIDRLDLVLSNLLDLTVPARLNATDQDLNGLVRAALRLTSRKLTHLSVQVETDLEEALPPMRIDGHKARQAFLNVILNAADAMPEAVACRLRPRAGRAASVCCSRTREPESTPRSPTRSSIRSSRPRPRASVWDCTPCET